MIFKMLLFKFVIVATLVCKGNSVDKVKGSWNQLTSFIDTEINKKLGGIPECEIKEEIPLNVFGNFLGATDFQAILLPSNSASNYTKSVVLKPISASYTICNNSYSIKITYSLQLFEDPQENSLGTITVTTQTCSEDLRKCLKTLQKMQVALRKDNKFVGTKTGYHLQATEYSATLIDVFLNSRNKVPPFTEEANNILSEKLFSCISNEYIKEVIIKKFGTTLESFKFSFVPPENRYSWTQFANNIFSTHNLSLSLEIQIKDVQSKNEIQIKYKLDLISVFADNGKIVEIAWPESNGYYSVYMVKHDSKEALKYKVKTWEIIQEVLRKIFSTAKT